MTEDISDVRQARANKTYGSLGAVVGFMTWIWVSTTVILIGAQINAEMKMQTARDTTTGPEQPMGRGVPRKPTDYRKTPEVFVLLKTGTNEQCHNPRGTS